MGGVVVAFYLYENQKLHEWILLCFHSPSAKALTFLDFKQHKVIIPSNKSVTFPFFPYSLIKVQYFLYIQIFSLR